MKTDSKAFVMKILNVCRTETVALLSEAKATVNIMKTSISQKFSIAAVMFLILGAMGVQAANIFKANTATMSASTDWTTTYNGSTGIAPASGSVGEFTNSPVTAGNLAAMALGGNVSLTGLQFDGGANPMAGPLTIASGSTLTLTPASTLILEAGSPNVTINCGMAEANNSSTWTVTSAGTTLTVPSPGFGTATWTFAGAGNFNLWPGNIDTGNGTGAVLINSTGTFNANDIGIGKTGSTTTTVPTATVPVAASASQGFCVSAASTVNLSTLELSSQNGGCSSLISAGNTVVSNSVVVGNSSSGTRACYFQVSGGTFTAATNTGTSLLIAKNNGANQNTAELYISGGSVYVGQIVFGALADTVVNNGWLIVDGSAANLFVGSGGIQESNKLGGTSANVALTAGYLLATANWSTTNSITMAAAAPFNIEAANAVSAGTSYNITLAGPGKISGIGSINKGGGGILTLSGANTYTGTNILSAGTVNVGSVEVSGTSGPLGKPTTALGSIFFNGGTLQYSAANHNDYSSRFPSVGVNSQPISIDVNGQAVTFATALANSGGETLALQDSAGGGVLTLSSGANSYSGNTTISSGTLNISGAITGTGNVNINGGKLVGIGSIAGTVVVGSGGTLAPGSSGTGTLTVGGLTFNASSLATFSPGSDQVSVGAAGLTINGGAITLLQPGTSTPFTAPGTYTLATYSGSVGGTGATALSVANPQPYTTYNFIDTGSSIQLQITSTLAIGTWNNGTSGNWSTAGNWTGTGTLPPHSPGDTAIFDNGTAASLATVTLDANESVGTLTVNNPNSFQITPAASQVLTLDNNGAGVNVAVTGGSQNEVNAAVSLNDNVTATVNSGDSLAFSSAINNASVPEKLTINGAGTTVLSAANGYGPVSAGTVGTVLSGGGILKVGNSGSLGSGDVTNAGSSTIQSGAAGLNLANNIGIASGATSTLDNNGNNLTLSGVISGTGGLTKINGGTLTLGGANSYSGNTTINAGVLSISSAGNVGTSPNIILNGGDLTVNGTISLASNIGIGASTTTGLIDAIGTLTVNGVIGSSGSSANNLTINGVTGTGTVVLNNANTYGGTTVINAGTLKLANANALQNSTLNYNNQGGALDFGTLTTVSLGGLTGAQNLILQNDSAAAVALTVNNSGGNTYSGNLSGSGSLTKGSSGTLTLTGTNTYQGNSTFNSGTVEIPAGGVITNAGSLSGQGVLVDGGSLIVSGAATFNYVANALTESSGNVNIGGLYEANSAGDGIFIDITGGSFTSPSINLQRTASEATAPTASAPISAPTTSGFYVDGSTANVSVGTLTLPISSGNSSATARLDAGTMNASGEVSIGGSGGGGGGRWNILQVNGGTFSALDTVNGIVISQAAQDGELYLSGGTTTAGRIAFGVAGDTSATGWLFVNGGASLYVGIGGIVKPVGADTATIELTSGILGATTNWSSSLPMNLNGGNAGSFTIQAADASGNPQNITLSGVLSGAAGLNKTGAGTLTLSSAGNTYSGITTNNAGTLNINSEYALGGANYSGLTFNGGTLQYAATLLNGTTDVSTKSVTFNGNATIDVNGNSINFANPIGNSGTGGLTVKSSVANGVLALAGADTYTGNTTVSSGTLLANNTSGSATGLGNVTVAAGAILGGTGTIGGATTLQSGAVLAAGNGGIGTLTLNTNLTLNALSTNTFAVTPANGVSNTVVVAGVLTPNNSVISITSGAALQPGNTYTLITYNTSYPVSGSFNPTPVFDVAPAQRGYISNDTVNGHIDLVIAPVTTPLSGASFTMNVTLGISSTVQVVGGKYPATDANGDPLSIASVTGETNGTVAYTTTNITYTATGSGIDSFSYTVTDGFGNTSTPGTVSVIIANNTPTSNPPNVVNQGMSGGNETMEFLGIPGFKYALDETHYLTPPVTWTPVVTNTAASDGTMHFTNTVSGIGDGDYYRTRYVP